jgi:GalNAc-alpha-(1->4)-GalNAc-alpha-(1->3)-diNAcBac-PP-undecaprenol alpha-1,4-N-acetyl-D-galactosaminyltransferase
VGVHGFQIGGECVKKLVVLIQSLGGGGAERVASILVGQLASECFKVTVVCIRDLPVVQKLDRRVSFRCLGVKRARYAFFLIPRELQGADVCLVFGHELGLVVGALKALRLLKTPTVYREGRIPWYYMGRLNTLLYLFTIGFHKRVIVQTDFMRRSLVERGLSEDIIDVVRNPIDVDDSYGSIDTNRVEFDFDRIVTLGRLSKEKGHARMVHAFAQILVSRPSLQLEIFGVGSIEAELKELVKSMSLDHAIHFRGFCDTKEALTFTSIFCLPSYSEGLPNALIEAICSGCRVMASGGESVREVLELVGLGEYYIRVDTFQDSFPEVLDRILASDREEWRIAAGLARRIFDKRRISGEIHRVLSRVSP